MASFIAIYDACVLHPAPLCDLLMRLAMAGLVRARWSDRILDEVVSSIHRRKPDILLEKLERRRRNMANAVPDCLVLHFEHLEVGLTLPDPDDRHVLAAAIRCGAQAIVTANLADFPDHVLAPYGIEAIHPDDFVLGLIDLSEGIALRVLLDQVGALTKPPRTIEDVLQALEKNGMIRTAARFRSLL